MLKTNRIELANDRAADRAIARLLHDGLFKSTRRGRFWHSVPFAGLAAVREYVSDHLRFVHTPTWVVDASARRRHADDEYVIRRAVRFELLEAV